MDRQETERKQPPPALRKVRKTQIVLRLIVIIFSVVGFLNLAPRAFFMPIAAIAHLMPEVRFAKAFWSDLLEDRDFGAAYQMTAASFRESHTEDAFAAFLQEHLDKIGWDASLALAEHASRSSSHYSTEGPSTRSSTALVGTRLTGSKGVSVAYLWVDKTTPSLKITRLDIVSGQMVEDSLSGESPDRLTPDAPVSFVFQPTNGTWRILPRKKEQPF